jgi:hypothetical protein
MDDAAGGHRRNKKKTPVNHCTRNLEVAAAWGCRSEERREQADVVKPEYLSDKEANSPAWR